MVGCFHLAADYAMSPRKPPGQIFSRGEACSSFDTMLLTGYIHSLCGFGVSRGVDDLEGVLHRGEDGASELLVGGVAAHVGGADLAVLLVSDCDVSNGMKLEKRTLAR
jgi:hypothetical protein